MPEKSVDELRVRYLPVSGIALARHRSATNGDACAQTNGDA